MGELHLFMISELDGDRRPASHTCHFTYGRWPLYTLDRRLGGPHSRSRRGGRNRNLLPLLEIKPQISSP